MHADNMFVLGSYYEHLISSQHQFYNRFCDIANCIFILKLRGKISNNSILTRR